MMIKMMMMIKILLLHFDIVFAVELYKAYTQYAIYDYHFTILQKILTVLKVLMEH